MNIDHEAESPLGDTILVSYNEIPTKHKASTYAMVSFPTMKLDEFYDAVSYKIDNILLGRVRRDFDG